MNIIKEWNNEDINIFAKNDNDFCCLDLGCGNGQFLTKVASLNKDNKFFAVERSLKHLQRTQKKIQSHNISNAILINGDVFTFLPKFFEPDFFDIIFINFPDPWFKKKHLKKRVIQSQMITTYHQYLKENGKIYFVTDNEEYRDFGINCFISSNIFKAGFESPYYVLNIENYPSSLYEEKWRKENKQIYYTIFIKTKI